MFSLDDNKISNAGWEISKSFTLQIKIIVFKGIHYGSCSKMVKGKNIQLFLKAFRELCRVLLNYSVCRPLILSS